jgi:CheY-like chemotaxis protein
VRLLIVEDEPFIAMDLEAIAAARGHEVVGVAASLDEAFDQSRSFHPDAAFVDINLSDGFTGVDVARQLVREGVRVGFVTRAGPARLRRRPRRGGEAVQRREHRRAAPRARSRDGGDERPPVRQEAEALVAPSFGT